MIENKNTMLVKAKNSKKRKNLNFYIALPYIPIFIVVDIKHIHKKTNQKLFCETPSSQCEQLFRDITDNVSRRHSQLSIIL